MKRGETEGGRVPRESSNLKLKKTRGVIKKTAKILLLHCETGSLNTSITTGSVWGYRTSTPRLILEYSDDG